jgi:3-hydroxyacyl-[acyl-carrier-protein] dehydratase
MKEDPKESAIEGYFHFPSDDPIYKTHFPQHPVVPGSLIVHAFLQALEGGGLPIDGLYIEKFSFREFLSPGAYEFKIERRVDGMECRITKDGKKFATGTLKYGA